MAQIDLKKCTFRIQDAGNAHGITLKVAEGALTYTEKQNRVYVKDRGLLSTVRNGDDEPVDVKFDLIWEFISATVSSGTPTPVEALKNIGEAAGWTTSDSDTCAPYSVDIVIVYNPNCSPTQEEKITLSLFRYEDLNMNLKDGQISCSGKCNIVQATPLRF